VPEAVQPYYTPAELQVILKALRSRRLRGVDAHRMRAIILLLFDCGLRSPELCGLEIQDISWDNQAIIVRQAGVATGASFHSGQRPLAVMLAYLRARMWSPRGSSRHLMALI
jgi:integrase